METVFSMSNWKDVHDINISTEAGRHFSVDITKSETTGFDASVTVEDEVSDNSGSWIFSTVANGSTDREVFELFIGFVLRYLAEVDTTDSISKVINPCNDPFVKVHIQNEILASLRLPQIATLADY